MVASTACGRPTANSHGGSLPRRPTAADPGRRPDPPPKDERLQDLTRQDISDADYEELNAKLRAQARHVLQELDAGAEGFRDRAEAMIAEKPEKKKAPVMPPGGMGEDMY